MRKKSRNVGGDMFSNMVKAGGANIAAGAKAGGKNIASGYKAGVGRKRRR